MFHWSLYKFLDPELEQQVKDHLAEVKRKEWEEGTHAWHPLVRGERKQVDCHLGGVACAKKKVGAHAPGNQSRGGKRAVKKTNSQRWQCLVTGHISTPGPLTRYQVARGIDPKNRQLLKG